MARVEVSRSVLRWAIERSGKASAVRQKFPKLREWERGESQPTLRQLEKLAKETATPFGYLFLPEPPEERLPIPHFRTLEDQPTQRPSPDLLETVHTMERRQAWMREYLADEGEESLPFVRSARLREEPQQVARKMRETVGLTQAWAANQPTWTEALTELRHRMEGPCDEVILPPLDFVLDPGGHQYTANGTFHPWFAPTAQEDVIAAYRDVMRWV